MNITRIYQGRITSVTPVSGTLENEFSPLWETHSIFQDAVNYHTLALAAMAPSDGDHNFIGAKFRKRIESIWLEKPRGDDASKSLSESVSPWLGLDPDKTSFDDAAKVILEGCSNQQYLPHVLSFVIDKIAGNIQQEGRALLPKICAPEFNGNFDYSKASKFAAKKKSELIELLNAETLDWNCLKNFASEMNMSWVGIKLRTDAEYKKGQDVVNDLNEALIGIKEILNKKTKSNWNNAIVDLGSLDQAIVEIEDCEKRTGNLSDSASIPPNNKTAKELKWAALFFQFFPSPLSAKLLKIQLGLNQKEQKKSEKIYDYTRLHDDPLLLCRGERKYIYRGFSALPQWSQDEARSMYSSELDIAAFKEALKTLNQFSSKSEEREKNREKKQNTIDYILGKTDSLKREISSEDDDFDENSAVLGGDPRYELLCKMVKEMHADDDVDEHGVSIAGLKGYRDVWSKWREVIESKPLIDSSLLEDKLLQCVSDVQSKLEEKFGDPSLFRKLCSPSYMQIWNGSKPNDGKERSNNILRDYCELKALEDECKRLGEPVRVTAADAKASPRFLMVSDLKGGHGVKWIGKNCLKTSLIEYDECGKLVLSEKTLVFSAPRSSRDVLDLSKKTASEWLPPMLKPVFGEDGDVPRYLVKLKKEAAVALAPLPFRSTPWSYRYLLNFPVTFEVDALVDNLGKQRLWNGQFNGTRDKHIHLKWAKDKEECWWEKSEIKENGFSVLSADLGQRFAFAWALVDVRCGDSFPLTHDGKPRQTHLLGVDGNGISWNACSLKQGISRLEGEGATASCKKDATKYGKQGRESTEQESKEARLLLMKMGYGASDLGKTFVEENAYLLRCYGRCLSRTRTFLSWCVKLQDEKKQESCRKDIKAWFGREKNESQSDDHAFSQKIQSLLSCKEGEKYEVLLEVFKKESARLQQELPKILCEIANRVLTQRKKLWTWKSLAPVDVKGISFIPHRLVLEEYRMPSEQRGVKIMGQGGLSMRRLEMLGDLKQYAQSLNRIVNREPGESISFGSVWKEVSIPDPCPLITEKLNEMREQRVNQTAHCVLAQALGVRLKPSREGKNVEFSNNDVIHGEYEKIPGRKPVDMIVLENLSRYRTGADRTKRENSRLMQWSHRAILDKIKQLAEPLGIPVLETAASYTSKFDCMSGAPGFRAAEIKASESFKVREDKDPYALKIRECMGRLADKQSNFLLIIPQDGGEWFVPAVETKHSPWPSPRNADINAAVNIGLRALAPPQDLLALHRVRLEKTTSKSQKIKKENTENFELWTTRKKGNRREVDFFGKAGIPVQLPEGTQIEGQYSTAFIDPLSICGNGQRLSIEKEGLPPLVHSKLLWGKIKSIKWELCFKINLKRIEKKGISGFDDLIDQYLNSQDDDIPI